MSALQHMASRLQFPGKKISFPQCRNADDSQHHHPGSLHMSCSPTSTNGSDRAADHRSRHARSDVMMFFMLQYIRTLPTEMEEAAMIDGMGRGGIIVTIVFPMMVPAFIAQAALSFSGLTMIISLPALFGRRPRSVQCPACHQPDEFGLCGRTRKTLAACVVALIPTFVLFILAQKFFRRNNTHRFEIRRKMEIFKKY